MPLSAVLGFQPDTLEKVANGRGRGVTGSLAIRVARFLGASVDDLLTGRFLPGACCKCGHVKDFGEEETVAEAVKVDGLTLVK